MLRRVAGLSLVIGLLASRGHAADPNLVARWSLDDLSGADSSGHELRMSLVPTVSSVPGSSHTNGVHFGPGSGFGQVGATTLLEPRQRSWSVSLWLRTTRDTTQLRNVVSWYRCGANPLCGQTDAAYYMLYVGTDDRVHWELRGDGAADLDTRSGQSLSDSRWHHVVGTYSFSTHRATLFVDGAMADTVQGDLGAMSAGSIAIPFQVGRMYRTGWGQPGNYFNGAVDEIRIYDRELSAADVSALFQSGAVGVESGGRPSAVRLGHGSPNPFRRMTRIPFALRAPARVRLSVMDVAGREIAVIDEGVRGVGEHTAEWDGRDVAGSPSRGGVYFYHLIATPIAGGAVESRTVRGTLIR